MSTGIEAIAPNILRLSSDIVIGFVQPVGTDLCSVRRGIKEVCEKMRIPIHYINMTDLIQEYNHPFTSKPKDGSHNYVDIDLKMSKGNELRKAHGNEIFSMYSLAKIFAVRNAQKETETTRPSIFVLDSFKHKDEVELIRRIYGQSFFLFAISSENRDRVNHLIHHKGMGEIEAHQLMIRDEGEKGGHGQQMRKVFQQADVFLKNCTALDEIQRIIELILGNPKLSPSRSELWMYLAAGAAAKSSDPSRQVGAAIVSESEELLALGPNDVPSPLGGLYSFEDDFDERDEVRGFEQNHRMREVIKERIVRDVESVVRSGIEGIDGVEDGAKKKVSEEVMKGVREKIENVEKLEQLTEYVRAVHGEMEAIISCARKGISTVNATLYCTTFPCHNCAKHIVNAGIRRVMFIEPYQKSLATFLHGDAILSGTSVQVSDKVLLEQFSGIGPRRFLDFFSVNLSCGKIQDRKGGKDVAAWEISCFSPRTESARFFAHFDLVSSCEYESARWLVDKAILHESAKEEQNASTGRTIRVLIEKLRDQEIEDARAIIEKVNSEKQAEVDKSA